MDCYIFFLIIQKRIIRDPFLYRPVFRKKNCPAVPKKCPFNKSIKALHKGQAEMKISLKTQNSTIIGKNNRVNIAISDFFFTIFHLSRFLNYFHSTEEFKTLFLLLKKNHMKTCAFPTDTSKC